MSKYIEIDELISAIKTAPVWTGLDAITRIETLPAIDILRCKECRWWINNLAVDDTDEAYDACRWDWNKDNPKADDYCSYGERKDEPYEYEIKALHKDYVEPYVKIEDEPQTDCSWK